MRLVAATPQLISVSMTREEILRAAEYTFTNPTPLIQAMMALLRRGDVGDLHPQQSADPAVHCPACGSQLEIKD